MIADKPMTREEWEEWVAEVCEYLVAASKRGWVTSIEFKSSADEKHIQFCVRKEWPEVYWR